MKLLYRGISYEAPSQQAPLSESTSQQKVRLIYRGSSYEYQPQTRQISELPDNALTVTLMYRGQTYQRKLALATSYQQPRALNWRWQAL
jgi:hypothetical protein